MPRYTILGARWFVNHDATVGVVAIQTFDSTWKAFLGMASGTNIEADEQYIAAWGNALLPKEAHGFFPHLAEENYKTQ